MFGANGRRSAGIVGVMASDARLDLDGTDRALIAALQRDGRLSIADLGRLVSMSPSATGERLRRLTEAGIITGYVATLSPAALGYSITAFVRLAYPTGNYDPLHRVLDSTPEVVEAHHVTGDDCFLFKVHARGMLDLERITGRLATLGSITTSVVYSSPLDGRALDPA